MCLWKLADLRLKILLMNFSRSSSNSGQTSKCPSCPPALLIFAEASEMIITAFSWHLQPINNYMCLVLWMCERQKSLRDQLQRLWGCLGWRPAEGDISETYLSPCFIHVLKLQNMNVLIVWGESNKMSLWGSCSFVWFGVSSVTSHLVWEEK